MDTHLGTPRPCRGVRGVTAGVLSPLLVAALATGCSGSSDRARDAGPSPDAASSSTGSPDPSGTAEPGASPSGGSESGGSESGGSESGDDPGDAAEDARLVSVSGAGGTVDPRPTPLDDRAAVAAFTRPFEGPSLPGEIQRTWAQADADAGAGETVVAAVVDVSCQAPERVEVRARTGGLRVVAVPLAGDGERQCLVSITTVAVLTVPADAV